MIRRQITGKLAVVFMTLFIALTASIVHADLIGLWEFDYESMDDIYGTNHGEIHGHVRFSEGHTGVGRSIELREDPAGGHAKYVGRLLGAWLIHVCCLGIWCIQYQ